MCQKHVCDLHLRLFTLRSTSLILVCDIFPAGENLKETDGNKTTSITCLCEYNLSIHDLHVTEKSKGKNLHVFLFRTRMDVGWLKARLLLNVYFADKVSHLYAPKLV